MGNEEYKLVSGVKLSYSSTAYALNASILNSVDFSKRPHQATEVIAFVIENF